MTVVLLAWGGSNKPDLVIYDVQFFLVQATDPLSDVMVESHLKSIGLSEAGAKEFADKMRKSRDADPYDWSCWVQFYIKHRGDKDAFRITLKQIPPPNTTKEPPPFIRGKDWEESWNWDEFYLIRDEFGLDYLKSGAVRQVTNSLCSGKFRQKPSQEILDKLKGTRIEIVSFEREP